jgi:hypothetical protein
MSSRFKDLKAIYDLSLPTYMVSSYRGGERGQSRVWRHARPSQCDLDSPGVRPIFGPSGTGPPPSARPWRAGQSCSAAHCDCNAPGPPGERHTDALRLGFAAIATRTRRRRPTLGPAGAGPPSAVARPGQSRSVVSTAVARRGGRIARAARGA